MLYYYVVKALRSKTLRLYAVATEVELQHALSVGKRNSVPVFQVYKVYPDKRYSRLFRDKGDIEYHFPWRVSEPVTVFTKIPFNL